MIGERLLELRKDAGLTQNELAAILNINKHSISSYERDRSEPPDELKVAMAAYFGVSVDYLLGVSDTPFPYREQLSCIRSPVPLTEEEHNKVQDYLSYLIFRRGLQK